MKGFDVSKQNLSRNFEELLSKGGDNKKAEELISKEVDLRVKELENAGVKIDPIEGELFIKKFKEERLAEFEKLVSIKEQGGKLSNEIEMNYNGVKWILKLRNPEIMDSFFEELVKNQQLGIDNILND